MDTLEPDTTPVGHAEFPQWLERLLYLCFFLSGAAGLIYQVSWMKALTLVFGRTTYAITAVLCAFMGGLALGSWLLGRYADRGRGLLRVYGFVELGIATTGLASLLGVELIRSVYYLLYARLAELPGLLLAYRFVSSFLLLLIPTTLMGGTYPLVVKYMTRTSQELGNRASRLYWLNTAGAVLGASLAGFVLLSGLGLRRTLVTAAALNLAAGLLVLASAARLAEAKPAPEAEPVEEAPTPGSARLILLASGVSGLTGMMFEIGWTRILSIFISSTTYAFTLMLATFLLGISLGSYWFDRRHRRWSLGLRLLGDLQIVLALAAVLFLVLTTQLAELGRWLAWASGESALAILGTQFLVSFLAMILPTTLFGVVFPLTVVLYCGQDQRRGTRAGTLYAVNTVGAILGAFLTGFFFVRWFGTISTLLLAIGLNAAVATTLFWTMNPRSWRRVGLGLVLLVALGTAAGREWFVRPVIYGMTLVGNAQRSILQSPLRVDEIVGREELLFAEEGINATVVVARQENYVSLRTDGKTEASTGDSQTQLLLGYVPVSLHPKPRRVLVIGLGSGATVHAVAQFADVERIDCVEIEPAVLRAAPHLVRLNYEVYKNPKVRVILDDARNFLFVSRERYDAIISEPSYLWSAGIASLFTREFYQQVREHLEPGGVFLQWVQAYQMAPRDFRTVLSTLGGAFGHMSLWRGSSTDFLLLASPAPIGFTLEHLTAAYRQNAQLRADFEQQLKTQEPAGLLGYFLLGDGTLRELAAGVEWNTDDRPVLEYRAPYSISKQTSNLNHALVRLVRKEVFPQFVQISDPVGALVAGAETQILIGMLNQPLGASFVEALLRDPPKRARAQLIRAVVAVQRRQFLPAVQYLQEAEAMDPRDAQIPYELARLYSTQGADDRAERALEKCLQIDPGHVRALRELVRLAEGKSRWDRALGLQQRVIALNPSAVYEEWALLGEIYLARGEIESARSAFQKSLELEPMGYTANRNLAALLAREGRVVEAIERYSTLTRYHAEVDAQVYLDLSLLYRRQGLERDARHVLRKAQRLFPADPRIEHALWGRPAS